jgi:hypothetical protein
MAERYAFPSDEAVKIVVAALDAHPVKSAVKSEQN